MSLRHRLILWHSGLFVLGLLGFSLVIWFGAQSILNHEIERWLATQADGLERFLHLELKGTDEQAVIEEAREFSTGLPRDSGVQLFRGDGTLLLSQPMPMRIVLKQNSSWTAEVDGNRTRLVSRSTSIEGKRYQFVLWRSYQDAESTLSELAKLLASLTPLFLLLSVAGGWWLSRHALKPVDDLTTAARSISLAKLSSRLPLPPARDELYRLCDAWNEMLARLEQSAVRLNQFTADASHELRTPLAVIRATAELALRQQRGSQAYRDALERIKEQSVEMSGLVEDLLSLARSEEEDIRSSFCLVDLASVAREVRAAAKANAESQQLALSLDAPQEVFAFGDAASLRRLLLILVDNALKFTPGLGQIHLSVSTDREGHPIVEVQDSGIGISSEALPKIFDRFYQSDPSRSLPGTGLGLSLARWIATSHSATVEVNSAVGQGTVFRVVFPSLGERKNGP